MGFVKEGKKVEREFGALFSSSKVIYSSKEEDINDHWDLMVEGQKYDVKGVKKTLRNDSYPNEFYHYIEIKNVNGDDGWLYGKADYFAFQTHKYFVIVDKEKLQGFIKKNTHKEYVNNADESLYCLYSRADRKDVITMITTIDLCSLSNFIIERKVNEYEIGTSVIPEIRQKNRIAKIFKK